MHLLVKQTPFWLLLLALTVFSLLPTAFLPHAVFSIWDKVQHASGFACLTWLGVWAYPRHPARVAAALLVHGALIELAQAATGWRTGDWRDLLADAIGIALALLFWSMVVRTRRATAS